MCGRPGERCPFAASLALAASLAAQGADQPAAGGNQPAARAEPSAARVDQPAARADQPAARVDQPARPPLALQEFSALLGAWRCTGTLRAAPAGPALHTQGSWTFARDLDGFWIAAAFEHARTPENPAPAKGKGHFGYDEEQLRFIGVLALNDGTSEQSSSGGWDGPRLVFQGQLRDGDERVPFRRTFEKRDRGLKLTLELQLDEGKWLEVAEESCTRAH